jgi:hypothetical protein
MCFAVFSIPKSYNGLSQHNDFFGKITSNPATSGTSTPELMFQAGNN